MEEIDLCWKLNRSGRQLYYTGKSHVFHIGAGTLAYHHPRKTYLNFRNGLMMLIKHLGSGEMIFKLPVRVLLDRSEEHTSELQSRENLVCRLLLEKKKETPAHHSSRH